MAREEDAAAAIKALHNTNFKGATINVEQSTGKSRGGGGGGGGRRDDRRGGPMRGGRGGRDGGRDSRPGPYNDRRGLLSTATFVIVSKFFEITKVVRFANNWFFDSKQFNLFQFKIV